MSQKLIAGVDEAGRGPLAGPVIASAVILDPNQPIFGLMDSKKLSEKKREALFDEIYEKALAVSIGRASVEEIDSLNILQATMLAMTRAVVGLSVSPDAVWVDGNRLPSLPYPAMAIVQGDSLHAQISAASIIAKVSRDREMVELSKRYPAYGFDGHKGYGTVQHMSALAEHGASPIHRRSFAPVREAMLKHSATETHPEEFA